MKREELMKSIIVAISGHWRLTLAAAVACVAVAWVFSLRHCRHDADTPLVGIRHNERIEVTPEEIRAIRDIGQWECFSVETEEMVEHHEAHTFGNDHLVKIYHGRLSLGIDMQDVTDDWFRDSLSTAIITLPAVRLLDTDFIDEARTVTFYEKGRFNAATQQRLYDKAAAAMRRRAMSPENIALAEQSARDLFTRFFTAFGYKDVIVRFRNA